MQEFLSKMNKVCTATPHTLLVLTDNIEGLVKGKQYTIFKDVDYEWYVVDEHNDERHTFFSYNELKEELENDLELHYADLIVNNNANHADDVTDGIPNIDGLLVNDIKETINDVKCKLELLEIFVNNLSIEPVNTHTNDTYGDDNHDDDIDEWECDCLMF